jgi:hypothetical protein
LEGHQGWVILMVSKLGKRSKQCAYHVKHIDVSHGGKQNERDSENSQEGQDNKGEQLFVAKCDTHVWLFLFEMYAQASGATNQASKHRCLGRQTRSSTRQKLVWLL